MTEFSLEESHYRRYLNVKVDVAKRLRKLADDIDSISDHDHRSRRREPVEVIGQVTQTLLWGVANLNLDRMASWASSVYEVRAYEAARPKPDPALCGYSVTDPDRHCVLVRDHTLPYNGGLVHISEDGVEFV